MNQISIIAPPLKADIERREQQIRQRISDRLYRDRDRLFAWLFVAQWLFALGLAFFWAPLSWTGVTRQLHLHVYIAFFFGAALTIPPILLARALPGQAVTRHVIAVTQMLWSALLIHLSGGRIETHFHIFGSLAFLAFYRDHKVLFTATVVAATDHLIRAMFWPESVYGLSDPEWWRFLEHTFWILFEDVVLVMSITEAQRALREISKRQAETEWLNSTLEQKVRARTEALSTSRDELKGSLEALQRTQRQLLDASNQLGDTNEELTLANSQLELRLRELRAAQSQLVQAEKLAAVGQLAAGLAHEINTPIQFISSNVRFVQDAFQQVADGLAPLRSMLSVTPELTRSFSEVQKKLQLDYLQEEVPSALQQSMEGLDRVTSLIRSMQEFSHPSTGKKSLVELKHEIENALTISHNNWKNIAEVEVDYDPSLTHVWCLRDELNQVILNLLVNATHAIFDVVNGQNKRGKIKIQTRAKDGWVEISISDTGTGIPEEIQHRIFEPFFTTKEVGRGTGQGLAISYSNIVDKHKGQLLFDTKVGVGSTFTIRLPRQED